MTSIRHGREQLPPDVARQQARDLSAVRRRCGWCQFSGTQDETDAHEDSLHLRDRITDLATSIRITPARNVLTFRNLFTAERAARLFLQAGIPCTWEGGNRPVLHTAADFPAKN